MALTFPERSYPRFTNETKMEQIAHIKRLIFSKTKADLVYRLRRTYSDAQKKYILFKSFDRIICH